MTNRTVLLTGGTGIMGSWVLGEALARGYRPIVLMRDSNPDRAAERVRAVLCHVDRAADLPNVRIAMGDASLPNLGLSSEGAHAIRREIDAVIHCAACTTFSPEKDSEIWSTNVGGVQNLLSFLEGTSASMYHVSTAYVAGKRTGAACETELDVGQPFNNTYERSKCESEKLVQTAINEGRLRGAIFRPSIITGSTHDGRISQFMNFYNLLRIIDLLAQRKGSGMELIRVAAAPHGTKNLIPVDWAIQALWTIIENEGPSGEVYHLTNPDPMSHAALESWANAVLEPAGLQVALVKELDSAPNSLETLFTMRFANYRPYMDPEPQFDRSNTDRALRGSLPFPRVDIPYFHKLLEFAHSMRWRSLFDGRADTSQRHFPGRAARIPMAASTFQAGVGA